MEKLKGIDLQIDRKLEYTILRFEELREKLNSTV